MSGDKIKVEAASQERSVLEAQRAAPVSLPAGSFESADIAVVFDDAAKAKNDDKRDDLIAAALEKHNGTEIPVSTLGLPPGYKRVEADVEELGITETRTVYDPSQKEEAEAAQAGATVPIQPGADLAPAAPKGE